MFDAIPDDLRELKQWVCARSDSKCPWMATELNPASSTDSRTWSWFDSAVASVDSGFYDNIGFVFANNGIIGIDIDIGYDEEGFLSMEAAQIIGLCHSYTERSRSGRGFHIFVKGTLPFKGRNNQHGLEIYSSGRYFITTGDMVLFDRIVANQEAIDAVVAKYFQSGTDDTETSTSRRNSDRAYHPVWRIPGKTIPMRPTYPSITTGGRNLCLTSLAGMLRNAGYSRRQMYDELLVCNETACLPKLDTDEIRQIVNSVMRYRT